MTSNGQLRLDPLRGAHDRAARAPLIDGIVWWEGTPLASGTAPPEKKGERPTEADAAGAPQQAEIPGASPADSW